MGKSSYAKIIVAIDFLKSPRLVAILDADDDMSHFLEDDYKEAYGDSWEYEGEASPGVYTADITVYSYQGNSFEDPPEWECDVKLSNLKPLIDIPAIDLATPKLTGL